MDMVPAYHRPQEFVPPPGVPRRWPGAALARAGQSSGHLRWKTRNLEAAKDTAW